MTNDQSLMEFPCDFLIKIIGKNSSEFARDITSIIHSHFPKTPADLIQGKPSQQGNYLAISATIHALDQISIDALYLELTKHPDIKMVL